MRVGHGHLHLYDQPPRTTQRSTVHHLGVQTDELEQLVDRLRGLGVSITDIRDQRGARYAMAEAPDGLLVELFEPDLDQLTPELRDHFYSTA